MSAPITHRAEGLETRADEAGVASQADQATAASRSDEAAATACHAGVAATAVRAPVVTSHTAPRTTTSGVARRPGRSERVRATTRLHARVLDAAAHGTDRGDVPGWVLVTVMSAGVVLAIWAAAETVLPQVFREAVTNVRRP